MRQMESVIGTAIVLLVIVAFFVLRRRHVAEQTAKILDPDPPIAKRESGPH